MLGHRLSVVLRTARPDPITSHPTTEISMNLLSPSQTRSIGGGSLRPTTSPSPWLDRPAPVGPMRGTGGLDV